MTNGNGSPNGNTAVGGVSKAGLGARNSSAACHPAWSAFVRFCERLQHGEIEKLRIQDGLPVLAELTTKKVKFT
jgi:hypothetical protein